MSLSEMNAGASYLVVVVPEGFWFLKHWKVWTTREPLDVVCCWSKERTGEVVRSFAADGGEIAVLENGKLTVVH